MDKFLLSTPGLIINRCLLPGDFVACGQASGGIVLLHCGRRDRVSDPAHSLPCYQAAR